MLAREEPVLSLPKDGLRAFGCRDFPATLLAQSAGRCNRRKEVQLQYSLLSDNAEGEC